MVQTLTLVFFVWALKTYNEFELKHKTKKFRQNSIYFDENWFSNIKPAWSIEFDCQFWSYQISPLFLVCSLMVMRFVLPYSRCQSCNYEASNKSNHRKVITNKMAGGDITTGPPVITIQWMLSSIHPYI